MLMLMPMLILRCSVPALRNAMSTKHNDVNAMPSRDAYRMLYIDMNHWMLHTRLYLNRIAFLTPHIC
jgi:hypothetical protein